MLTDDEVAELIQLLGAADRVVGIGSSIAKRGYFPEMADKPVTGSQFRRLNYELIAELNPDVVVMMDVGPVGKIVDELDRIGVKCIVISIRPDRIPNTITLLGGCPVGRSGQRPSSSGDGGGGAFLRIRISSIGAGPKLKVFVGMGF